MKYLRYMLYRLVFVAFTKIGRIKPLYEVVGCLQCTGAKQKQTRMLTALQTNFRSHACIDSELFSTMQNCTPIVLNLFQTRDTITVLYQFITLTQFLFSIHEYFLICESSKCLIWQL